MRSNTSKVHILKTIQEQVSYLDVFCYKAMYNDHKYKCTK